VSSIVHLVSTQESTQRYSSSVGKRRAQGEGTIYYDVVRRRWIGQAWIDGHRRKVSGRTKLDASAALGRLVHGAEAARKADRRATVGRLLADWQTKAGSTRSLAPSTRETHAWAVRLLTAELGTIRLADLDVHAVERALGRLARGSQGRPLGRASLIKVRSTARQACAWAEKRRLIGHNPAAVAELPSETIERARRFALDAKQLRALFTACEDHPHGAMFVLMGSIGLRPGEAAGLCDDAVDLHAGTLTVMRAVQLERGRPVLTTALKTAASRRTIRLPAIARDALNTVVMTTVSGLLFTAPDGGPLWPSTVRAELVKLCDEAGVLIIRPNELRHSAATLMAEAGLPLHRIADILGQTSTRMLDQTYRHRPPIVDDADAIERALWK
jgi:integrase